MAATAKATETKIMIDRAAHTITMTRSFEAPPERVFEAWTRPEHIICWWDPSGVRLADCEVDLRPGGRFKFRPPDLNEFAMTPIRRSSAVLCRERPSRCS